MELKNLRQKNAGELKAHLVDLQKEQFALRMIAEKAKAAGVEKVAFDRSGYRYHGRIKALADAAREGGLQF